MKSLVRKLSLVLWMALTVLSSCMARLELVKLTPCSAIVAQSSKLKMLTCRRLSRKPLARRPFHNTKALSSCVREMVQPRTWAIHWYLTLAMGSAGLMVQWKKQCRWRSHLEFLKTQRLISVRLWRYCQLDRIKLYLTQTWAFRHPNSLRVPATWSQTRWKFHHCQSGPRHHKWRPSITLEANLCLSSMV